jgi:hypothetical protein
VRVLEIIRRKSAPALAALLALAVMGRADQIEYSAYHVDLNSDVAVATTSFSLVKTLWQRTVILMDIQLDQTTTPPLEGGITGSPDVITGASRPARHSNSAFRKNRGQITGGVEQGLGDNTKVMGSYYFSQETDYQSQSFIGSVTREMADKNFTMTLRAQYTMDSVGEILLDGSIPNLFKETHQLSFIATQLLSTTTVLRAGADALRNHGMLSDPYSKVSVRNPAGGKDLFVTERHPTLRFRQAAWAELSQYLRGLDASLILGYRYYWDDWGLTSNAATLQINKYVTPDWVFSPEYRYYSQTGADFGDYAKQNPGAYDLVDGKLKPFGANTAGAGVTCFLRTFSRKHPTWDFVNNSSVSFTYLRYFDDLAPKNISANLYHGSLKFTF